MSATSHVLIRLRVLHPAIAIGTGAPDRVRRPAPAARRRRPGSAASRTRRARLALLQLRSVSPTSSCSRRSGCRSCTCWSPMPCGSRVSFSPARVLAADSSAAAAPRAVIARGPRPQRGSIGDVSSVSHPHGRDSPRRSDRSTWPPTMACSARSASTTTGRGSSSTWSRRFGAITFERGVRETIIAALTRYFAGHLHALAGLPAEPGGTPFQSRVWRALCGIPAGRTGPIASSPLPSASRPPCARSRAANGRNPIPLVIPCHRVIGADGRLVGYGGGLDRKTWLLRHEGVFV